MGIAALLRAAGVGAGDEVVVPAFGNVEVARAVTLAGALPVFADIDPATYCLDPAAVDAALTPRTAAVVVVHRFGHPADLGQLRALGQRRGLLVLEHTELDVSRDETARRRERAAYLDARLRGVRTPEEAPATAISSTSCGCPGTGGPTGTRSRAPYGPRELHAGYPCRLLCTGCPSSGVTCRCRRPSGPPTRRSRCPSTAP